MLKFLIFFSENNEKLYKHQTAMLRQLMNQSNSEQKHAMQLHPNESNYISKLRIILIIQALYGAELCSNNGRL